MSELDKQIMVIRKENLFGNDYFQGFMSHGEVDFESRILDNLEWMKREVAEKDPRYKQPICYCIIVNPVGQVFAYQRSIQDTEYPEKRLQGKYSWGIGGHIEEPDAEIKQNPIRASMLRELEEEIKVEGSVDSRAFGYINDDATEVGKVHFGILYIVETNSKIMESNSLEITSGRMRMIEEIEKICSSPELIVEEWSRISLKPLKSYLQNL